MEAYEIKEINEYYENIIHDFKTPVSILSYLIGNLGKMEIEDQEMLGIISQMDDCCNQLMVTAGYANSLIKKDGNIICPMKLINYDIISLTENIVHSTIPLAQRKDIEIIFDADTEEKVMAIDKNIFERLMLNILSNAIKFSPKNSYIKVMISDKGEYITIDIKDCGKGITPDVIDSVFIRYEKDDIAENRKGTGIGLDIVKKFVNQLNGEIKVNSNPYRNGTVFSVKLPVEIIDKSYDIQKTIDSLI